MSRILPEPRCNTPLPDCPALGNGPDDTQHRHARMAAAGWTVLPIGPRRLRGDGLTVLREMEAAFLAGLQARFAG